MQVKVRSVISTARRTQIVRAAIETLADVGFDKTSFAEITRRAGLSSQRLISYHFEDKNELLWQIVNDIYSDAAHFMDERMKGAGSALERLRTYIGANLEFLRDHPREIAALTEIGPHLSTRSGDTATSMRVQQPVIEGLASILYEGQENGEFVMFDVQAVAVMIRASIERAAQWLHADPPLDFDSYRQELIHTFSLTITRSRDSVRNS
ncbi:TetR/AcrR family transcriptional regulator [Brevibacterium oceani]|uniref:TetR/AcrR family transcriptional regulator n=1 Tax=Brevibacterium oceani TaxID=358099 RepID=UPI001B319604|nr:TetR/AcrR family transcriptional regulator [Brevibacterium oceani]